MSGRGAGGIKLRAFYCQSALISSCLYEEMEYLSRENRIRVEESFYDLVREIRKANGGGSGGKGPKKAGRRGCNLL